MFGAAAAEMRMEGGVWHRTRHSRSSRQSCGQCQPPCKRQQLRALLCTAVNRILLRECMQPSQTETDNPPPYEWFSQPILCTCYASPSSPISISFCLPVKNKLWRRRVKMSGVLPYRFILRRYILCSSFVSGRATLAKEEGMRTLVRVDVVCRER